MSCNQRVPKNKQIPHAKGAKCTLQKDHRAFHVSKLKDGSYLIWTYIKADRELICEVVDPLELNAALVEFR